MVMNLEHYVLGIDMQLTPERIRQIESKALRKLRHPSRSMMIRKNIRFSEYRMLIEEREKARLEKKSLERAEYLKSAIQDLDNIDLSVRTRSCLYNNEIKTIEELCIRTEKEMLYLPNFGRKSLNELKIILASYGLRFGMF